MNKAYLLGMVLACAAMPFSNFLMSQAAIFLGLLWLIDGVRGGWTLPKDKSILWLWWSVWAVIAVHAAGIFWSSDWMQGLDALRVKLPLFAFPLILLTGSYDPVAARKTVPWMFACSVLVACVAILIRGTLMIEPLSVRDWSPFISHIRFSLMMCFALGLLWWRIRQLERKPRWAWALLLGLGIASCAVIWKTASLTGALLVPAVLLWMVWQTGRRLVVGIGLGLGVTGALLAWQEVRPHTPRANEMLVLSEAGNPYVHYPEMSLRENGYPVWVNLAYGELNSAWIGRSDRGLDTPDDNGHGLQGTLIRYLTSMGLPKDSAAVEKLTDDQVRAVESGSTSVSEKDQQPLRKRLDVLAFELGNWQDGGSASGSSIVQRFEFAKTGWHIFKQHPVIGVGTGDLKRAFAEAYDERDSRLEIDNRLRAHNQYLSFALAGGPVAVLVWIGLLVAVARMPGSVRTAAGLFVVVLALSCITEDTLETQAGVTFAGFFIGWLGGSSRGGSAERT